MPSGRCVSTAFSGTQHSAVLLDSRVASLTRVDFRSMVAARVTKKQVQRQTSGPDETTRMQRGSSLHRPPATNPSRLFPVPPRPPENAFPLASLFLVTIPTVTRRTGDPALTPES